MASRQRVVSCPQCGVPVPWTRESRYRPFCSERCKMIDLGAWASEKYRVPAAERNNDDTPDDEESEGYVARIYATRGQVRAMAAKGAEAVAAGRPLCPLCDMPMDPAGHRCPRWN